MPITHQSMIVSHTSSHRIFGTVFVNLRYSHVQIGNTLFQLPQQFRGILLIPGDYLNHALISIGDNYSTLYPAATSTSIARS